MKLALADAWRNVTDPAAMTVGTAEMLDAGYLAARAKTIDMKRTQEHKAGIPKRSEEHTSELQSQSNLVCRLLLEKKKQQRQSADSDLHRITLDHRHQYSRSESPHSRRAKTMAQMADTYCVVDPVYRRRRQLAALF